MKRLIPLAVFPLVQVAAFVSAGVTYAEFPWIAAGLLAVSVLSLDLTVHIFLHECIHALHWERVPWPGAFALTAIGGLPFDGYRLHHYNHHRHDNGPEDFSTTWSWDGSGGRRPRNLLAYMILWPGELARARRAIRIQAAAGEIPPGLQSRLRLQKIFLGALLLTLALVSWPWALGYAVMVYGGWALVSLHNYGQHLPIEGRGPVTSVPGRAYNALLFNNGLHVEHHANPAVPWHSITPDPASQRTAAPHLVAPLLPGATRGRVSA